ncbi:histone-lysine N-methyltransferase, H3 lysine-9 specific SUVH5-like [Durio zibethinus]|uniref:Histone-lysine N-methyltransferase, H3 lysine-9 specific SUVH5-like n=1 Tax=Durio zibethinus TaxID=66656 RepID=A0A6P6ABG7_DURZI|nr:histone-lysine N-methyltransferase, H3 lysine-9 specific SUVH5-like [Durio zibethinus]
MKPGLIMVAVRPEPGNVGSSSKFKQAKEVGKRVLSDKGNSRTTSPADKERPFTAEWYASSRRIKEALSFYRKLLGNRKLLDELSQECGKNPERWQNSGLRVHMRVASVLESLGKWVNTSKQIGHVSGIKVGDYFLWRGELVIVGLHYEFQKGIDCMKLINGKTVATSIVDSGRYENAVGITCDKLIYCGEGENPDIGGRKKPKDQKLVGGNLALKNSMDDKMPVRVIRRFNNNDRGYKFVYDGLYRVTEFWKERGKFGKYVYKFSLRKIEGQPELDLGKRNKVVNGSVGGVYQWKERDIITAGSRFGEARNGQIGIGSSN